MITCRELTELLLEYLAGELSADRQQHIETHLGLCPPCVYLLETYQVTIKLSKQLPCQPLPADCEQRLRQAVMKQCTG
jgi:anti-sigma factor RsiW